MTENLLLYHTRLYIPSLGNERGGEAQVSTHFIPQHGCHSYQDAIRVNKHNVLHRQQVTRIIIFSMLYSAETMNFLKI